MVFDAATIRDAASYAAPKQPAEGIDAVVVNGEITWQHGRHTGARSGQVLRRDGATSTPRGGVPGVSGA